MKPPSLPLKFTRYSLDSLLPAHTHMSNPKPPPPPFVAEITVISAEGLNPRNPSSFFSFRRRLRRFITLSAASAQLQYKTTVAEGFGSNPKWGDAFRIPLDAGFFPDGSFVFLRLFAERLLFGPALIGWCRIPAADIGQPPVGSVRRLSYRLRKGDSSKIRAIVNLAVKVESLQAAVASPAVEPCRTVIGRPLSVAMAVFHGSW